MNSRVSVVVPTYNGEAYVGEALQSILRQSHPPFEVIVCDDGSTDDTAEVVGSFEGRVRLIHQANQGVSAARNRAARTARGEFLAFLDQDDLWEPDLLETQVALLESRRDCVLVYGDSLVVDSSGKVSGRRSSFLTYREGRVFEELLGGNFIPIETVVVRAPLFREQGGFNPRWKYLEDYELCLRLARIGSILYTPRPIARYRIHEDNLTHDMDSILLEYVEILEGIEETFPDLTTGERERAGRELQERFCEVAWYALRRGDVLEADGWLERNVAGCSPRLALKIRLLRGLERILPAWANRRLLSLLPRRKLYGL
jgi:glycosyltransferase involved in cell wall biosynthesis